MGRAVRSGEGRIARPLLPGPGGRDRTAGKTRYAGIRRAFRLNRAEHARWCDERGAVAKRVTITDVARETGVSIKTVSNVLNNTGSMRPETRQRVQDAIERLGYRVNVSARAMKTGGTKLIGLAITDFCQPFMPYLADSIVAAARSRGYAVTPIPTTAPAAWRRRSRRRRSWPRTAGFSSWARRSRIARYCTSRIRW